MTFYKFSIDSPEVLPKIPKTPGVYIFKSKAEEILYVGKAKDLRQRLSSYLRVGAVLSSKSSLMLKRAVAFEFIVTATEKEAFILEATLIKEHRPRYNILLRDDKAYPFLRLGIGHEFPKLSIVRLRRRDGALYFGPYPSGKAVKDTYRFVTALFGLRTCSDSVVASRSRACLKYQTGYCSAPCIKAISSFSYGERVREVRLFLEGKTAALTDSLESQMNEAALRLEFEVAAVLRDRLASIQEIIESQWIVVGMDADIDAVCLAREDEDAAVSVLNVREGVVRGQEIYNMTFVADEEDKVILSAFLCQYYRENPAPPEIVVPFQPSDVLPLSEWLSEMGVKRLNSSKVRGMRRRFLDMALENARLSFCSAKKEDQKGRMLLNSVKDVLALKLAPSFVEGVDISTTGGSFPIGSLVAFKDGKPYKKRYRHYNIRDVAGIDDYAMIRQVVTRRLSASWRDGIPDLLVIDGGRGQLNEALEAAATLGLSENLEIVSIAKERGCEGEKIYRPSLAEPLFLPRSHPVLLFLQAIRDEAHRFGVSLHRKRRDKSRLRSGLCDVPGVGVIIERRLLARFGSLKGVSDASFEEIAKVPGISSKLAKKICTHLYQ